MSLIYPLNYEVTSLHTKGRLTIVFGGPQGGLKSMFFYIFESGKKLKVGEILFLPL